MPRPSVSLVAMLSTMVLAVVLLVIGTGLYAGTYMAVRDGGAVSFRIYFPMVAMGYGTLVILALAVVELRFYLLRTRDLETREERLRQAVGALQLDRDSRGEMLGSVLHDEIGGGLTALRMELDLARRAPLGGSFGRCEASIDRLLALVRGVSRTLYPKPVGSLGLSAMLRGLSETMGEAGRQRIGFSFEGPVDDLPEPTVMTVMRIVQESVVNAARHSDGDRVEVKVAVSDGRVSGSVSDNGTGTGAIREGLGLTLLRERVRAADGSFSVRRHRDGGVEVSFRIPVAKEAAA